MYCIPFIASALALWQEDYWSGFQSPTDSGIIVLYRTLLPLPYLYCVPDKMKTYYTNATIYRGGRFETGCLAVEDGRVVTAGEPRPGDRIAFRKTATLADDFGRRVCRAAVRVALNGVPGRSGLWGAAVPAGRVLLEEYVPVPEREEEGAFRFDFGRTKEKALPAATVRRAGEGIYEITARAEKNGSCAYGSGDIVLLYPVPAAG